MQLMSTGQTKVFKGKSKPQSVYCIYLVLMQVLIADML